MQFLRLHRDFYELPSSRFFFAVCFRSWLSTKPLYSFTRHLLLFFYTNRARISTIDGLKKDSFIPLIPIVNPFMNNYGLFPTDRHLILRGLTWENLERLNPTSAASFIADIYRRLKKNDGIKKLFLPGIFSPRELRESVYMCVFASETRFYVYLFKQHALFLPPGIPISRRQWEEGAKRNVWRISGPIHYIYIYIACV